MGKYKDMRNRAKCKKCGSILESFYERDLVKCLCGEIAIDGGDKEFLAFANDFANFLRIDDEGKEIDVQYRQDAKKEDYKYAPANYDKSLAGDDLIELLQEKINIIYDLPKHVQLSMVTQLDLADILTVILGLFKKTPGLFLPVEEPKADPSEVSES